MLGLVVMIALTSLVSASSADGSVGQVAAPYTPSLHWTGTTQQVRQLVQCGATIYAVGSFTAIDHGGTTYTRHRAFSFSATTGAVGAWDPNVNGTVNSIAVSADCSIAYLGGSFSAVGSSVAHDIVAVHTATGAILSTFRHSANGKVETLLLTGGHLLVGGYFTSVNGGTQKYLASLDPTTGADDGYLRVPISGTYVYTDQGGLASQGGATEVYNLALSPDGSRVLGMGTFTSVAGVRRQQIFMLDLGATATLDAWYSDEFNAYCSTSQAFYVRAAAWSPDGGTVYVATTGEKPASGPGYLTTDPRAGLCAAVAAFSSLSLSILAHAWINYDGCDSYYSVIADSSAVYVGGHERWANNPNGCNVAGPGAVSRPGIGAISPVNGLVTSWNPTRARGLGADDLLMSTSPAGLWIASDNRSNTANACAGARHPGICLLPG